MRILIAEDHRMFREGLRVLLEAHEGWTVVAEAENGRQAVERARKHRPDVVIMDLSMPELHGVEATRLIASELPQTRVIALSMHSEKHFITETLKAGASAYVLKECAFDELQRAVEAAAYGRVYLSPAIAHLVLEDLRAGPAAPDASPSSRLSPREKEVLGLLARGKRTREIAALLHVSVKTVETHRQNLMKKLGVQSAYELTKYALREGLTSLDP